MSDKPQTRLQLVEAYILNSPDPAALEISSETIEPDRAVLDSIPMAGR